MSLTTSFKLYKTARTALPIFKTRAQKLDCAPQVCYYENMNAYDFDNTIFKGDSTARFWLFCMRTRPRTFAALPRIALHGARFAARLESKTEFKQRFFLFLAYLPDREVAVSEFWRRNSGRIKRWYLSQYRSDDVIISASPEFLLSPICTQLGISSLIASKVDPDSGQYSGLNCSGEEKPRRFLEVFGDIRPDRFYSDSLSDTPMARISHESFLVHGDKLLPWPSRLLNS